MVKNKGKQFEQDWKNSCPSEVYLYRLKDNSMWGKGVKVKTNPNPCDFIMFYKPYLFLLEMKSTKGTSFSFSEKIIKKNQIEQLLLSQEISGIIAGFLFNFRERKTKTKLRPNSVYFVPIKEFVEFKNNSNKNSINETDCKKMGIVIKNEIKIINYKYDIASFIRNIDKQSKHIIY